MFSIRFLIHSGALKRVGLSVCLLLAVGDLPQARAEVFADLFADQRTVYSSEQAKVEYRLTLSALKKINNEWVSEREHKLVGQVRRRTIELDRHYSLAEAWDTINSYFDEKQGRAIYECAGLDCGSSNAWANTRFDIKQLYGLDQNQYYKVWELSAGPERRSYVVAYMVERGTRKVYAQLDYIIGPRSPLALVASADIIADQLYQRGFVEVPGLTFEQAEVSIDPASLRVLASAINSQPYHSLYIVGHDYQAGDLSQQSARGKIYADAVYQALLAEGVNAQRLTVKSVGALAPLDNVTPARVVLVLKRD